jgi:hypothetical protein
MLSNNILKKTYFNLLKIWGLHIIIFYPICSFLAENLQKGTLNFKESIDFNSLTIALRYPVSIVFGAWDAFPFFIFMAFTISFLFKFVLKEKYFVNYVVSLITSYLIVYLIIIIVNNYNRLPYYFIIPSLIITFIIQMIIFRKDIFKNNLTENKL